MSDYPDCQNGSQRLSPHAIRSQPHRPPSQKRCPHRSTHPHTSTTRQRVCKIGWRECRGFTRWRYVLVSESPGDSLASASSLYGFRRGAVVRWTTRARSACHWHLASALLPSLAGRIARNVSASEVAENRVLRKEPSRQIGPYGNRRMMPLDQPHRIASQ